ncbi:aromatic amino acid aminotransferase apoenzyme [Loktanella fryxellensis]|uniref:Aromatic amino acid aminotransferase apoenzyme n=1 Tax=Loktanella fryxellensis TaxID=245187 RepID=A0A1H8AZG6_9RHOB|nr:amino acid aminotransferase [Loktanella fryxellensis]SEM75883.1 aromatic amino acid aminotransferase apoenzyme [Loktanella fryxellensis]
MFDTLKPQPADKILSLMQAYRADPRDTKVDLGVGVYKDASGNTPVMRAVKEAERRLVADQTTKAYVGLAGDPAFADAMIDLLLADTLPRDRIAAIATPGGTGAIRQALEMVKLAAPGATIWISDPSWPNHASIVKFLGLPMRSYRYFDADTRGVDIDGMIADLGTVAPGDVVLLHGCCHNPTGANPTADQWTRIVATLQQVQAVPLVDVAYQGFGDGLDQDAQATRAIAAAFPNLMIAASCSKNFGIYRERTGILLGITRDKDETALTQANLNFLNRQNYSFPPDHGARVVTTILTDPALRAEWEAELEDTRNTMLTLRQALADDLRRLSNDDRFDFIAHHRGMFSLLGTSADKVEVLRADHGIYMVSDSRMNIAGLNARTVPILAQAIIDAGI